MQALGLSLFGFYLHYFKDRPLMRLVLFLQASLSHRIVICFRNDIICEFKACWPCTIKTDASIPLKQGFHCVYEHSYENFRRNDVTIFCALLQLRWHCCICIFYQPSISTIFSLFFLIRLESFDKICFRKLLVQQLNDVHFTSSVASI